MIRKQKPCRVALPSSLFHAGPAVAPQALQRGCQLPISGPCGCSLQTRKPSSGHCEAQGQGGTRLTSLHCNVLIEQ